MYSRYSEKKSTSIQIPEHYSGCAFSKDHPTKETHAEKASPTRLEIGKPSTPLPTVVPSPKEDDDDHVKKEEHSDQPTPIHEKATSIISKSNPFSAMFGNLGAAFPFSHGIGFEELLILGLILLLARNEGESDIIPLLGLLLFCG